jgi:hypothetical protein
MKNIKLIKVKNILDYLHNITHIFKKEYKFLKKKGKFMKIF